MSARVPTPSDRPASATSRRRHSVSSRSSWSSVVRDGALGEVVDPLPAAPLGADHLAVHQGPLDGDLRLRPVPPLPAVLRAAQLRGRQRALGAQLLDHRVVGAVRQVVVPVRAGAVGAAAEGEVRPLLDRQDAGRVRPVLEGCGRPTSTRPRPCARPTAPRRAYGISSCERASTEIVSSWTAPRWRSTPGTPARRSGAPRNPWARRAIRRASSAERSAAGGGTGVMLAP